MTTAEQTTIITELATKSTDVELQSYFARAFTALSATDITPERKAKMLLIKRAYGEELSRRESAAKLKSAVARAGRIAENHAAWKTEAASLPATAAQISYIRSLLAADPGSCYASSPMPTTKGAASSFIDALKSEV